MDTRPQAVRLLRFKFGRSLLISGAGFPCLPLKLSQSLSSGAGSLAQWLGRWLGRLALSAGDF